MIVEDATLLKGTEESQVVGSKHKKIASGDKEGHWPSKKAKEKYHRDDIVKIRVLTPVRGVCIPDRIAQYTT